MNEERETPHPHHAQNWSVEPLSDIRLDPSLRRVTLLEGLPSSIDFRLSLYMSGRVTLGLGSPYHLGRVTLLVGPTSRA